MSSINKDQNTEVVIDRTNGGSGRINSIKIFHKGVLKISAHIYPDGEIDSVVRNVSIRKTGKGDIYVNQSI